VGKHTGRIEYRYYQQWCAVNATMSFRAMGKKTAMINYNPETDSTD
jgi:hypothetical protein